MIYLDNAATTLHKPKEVQEAVIAAFGQMGNSGRGASEPALKALGTVYDAREALARLFHAENASEIVFTANSTEALNIAIKEYSIREIMSSQRCWNIIPCCARCMNAAGKVWR